jgi:glycosyltransferase involved in cell wall biosynthesis
MSGRRIAAILPHLGLYGGNLRYFEIGNILSRWGIDFTIATPSGGRPEYFEYRGRAATFEELRNDPPDFLIASEQNLFDELRAFPAGRRFFYFIVEGTKREKEIARTQTIALLANSSGLVRRLRRYGREAVAVIGGVDTNLFRPIDASERERRVPGGFRVLTHGRFARRRKGTRLVAKAIHTLARRLASLELHFFDSSTINHRAGIPEDFRCRARVRMDLNVPREKLRLVYGSADLFVSAEKKAGWSNTTIEAMACGLPVVCTKSGTQDFARSEETALVVPRTSWHLRRAIRRMIEHDELRARLAAAGLEAARRFTWESTAESLLAALETGGTTGPRRTGRSGRW